MSFLAMFFLFYFGINAVIWYWMQRLLPAEGGLRWVMAVVFWVVVWSYPMTRVVEGVWKLESPRWWVYLTSLWMVAMVWSFLVAMVWLLVAPLVRLVWGREEWFLRLDAVPGGVWLAGLGVVMATAIAWGAMQAGQVVLTQRTLHLPRVPSGLERLRVAVVGDLHLGNILGSGRVVQVRKILDEARPDLILVVGDVVDSDVAVLERNGCGPALEGLRAPRGVYGVMGNHEFIAGSRASEAFLRRHGVELLRDQARELDGELVLVGRDDVSVRRFEGGKRRPLADILKGVDGRLPVILMDHQPVELSENAAQGVDLQVSGHTHAGQFWPANWIVALMYEVSRGHGMAGGMDVFVTCGAGTWGPQVRLGSVPEVVVLDLVFDEESP